MKTLASLLLSLALLVVFVQVVLSGDTSPIRAGWDWVDGGVRTVLTMLDHALAAWPRT